MDSIKKKVNAMALIKCRECGHDVSTEANKCPNCGAPVKKEEVQQPIHTEAVKEKRKNELNWKRAIGAIFLLLLIGWAVEKFGGTGSNTSNNVSSSSSESNKSQIHAMGEDIKVGYMEYTVSWASWENHLSNNPYLDKSPNASYLVIYLLVQNNDNKARTIPTFKLIDENGAEYDMSSNAIFLNGAIGLIEDLNPGVQKKGNILFDVPQSHTYKLKLSGGYRSSDNALVELNTR